MKLSVIFFFTAVFSVLAAPAPRPWCLRLSQPCWKLKRAVEAFDEHATQPPADRQAALDQATANINIFAAAAFEHLAKLAAQAQASLQAESFFEQSTATNERRSAPLWCIQQGEDALCWKRAADEQSEIDKRFCLRISQPCWKVKRAAESVLRAGEEGAQEECPAEDDACSTAKRHLDDLRHVAQTIIETF